MGKFAGLVKFTGKTGDIVGAKGTKGDYIAKAYQPTVKNPQTVGQIKTRVKFLTATGLAKMFLEANGFANIAKSRRVSAFNVMASKFFKQSDFITFDGTPTDMDARTQIDWAALQLSDGALGYPEPGTLNFAEEAEVKVPFTVEDAGNNDIVHVVIAQPDTNGVVHEAVNASASPATVRVPALWSGMRVKVYLFRQAADSETSRATYLSLFSNNSVAARATKSAIAGASEYSKTVYAGDGTVA